MSPIQRLFLLSLCLVLRIPQASAAGSCLKLVFERYCLGGDFDTFMRQMPPPLLQTSDREGQGAIYLEERERIYVLAFHGHIYKVVRQYRPATQMRFDELSQLVSSKYGSPQDRSRFPPYVKGSRASRIVAIRRGDGRALHLWPSQEGWRLELSWTREMGVSLSYIAEQLDAERRKALLGGL
jgi:hypothetical protein